MISKLQEFAVGGVCVHEVCEAWHRPKCKLHLLRHTQRPMLKKSSLPAFLGCLRPAV